MTVSINQIGSDNNGWLSQSEFNTWSTTGLTVAGSGAWTGMKNVSVLIHYVDNANVAHNITQVFTGTQGAWSVTFTPAQLASLNISDSTQFEIKAVVSGGFGDTGTLPVKVDVSPPSVTVDNVTADNTVNYVEAHQNLTVTGTASDHAYGQPISVNLVDTTTNTIVGTTSAIVHNDGTWSAQFANGSVSWGTDGDAYQVQAGVTDLAGNAGSATSAFNVDNDQPNIAINAVTGDNTISGAEDSSGFQISGTVTDEDIVGQQIHVQIQDTTSNTALWTGVATVGAGGVWSVNAPGGLPFNNADGYNVHVVTHDSVGNAGAADQSITAAVCFMPGTKIMTPAGEVNVETLKRGDLVVTTDGRATPISWLGRQTVSRTFADPLRVVPIRIKAGALGENVPSRDLLISPDHAVLIDGVLVQAGALVNGTSIVRETDVPLKFTYFHVELADHSLILADNVPAETFIDNVDRLAFDNWDEHQALYPEGQTIVEMPYPRAQSVRQVPRAIREQLAQRATAYATGAVSAA